MVQGRGGLARAHSSPLYAKIAKALSSLAKSTTLNNDQSAGLNSQASHRCYTNRKSGSEHAQTLERLYKKVEVIK